MGETADPKVQEAIRAGIEAEPEVERLIHLRTQHLGPDELLIGAKVGLRRRPVGGRAGRRR